MAKYYISKGDKVSTNKFLTQFVKRAKVIHNNRYKYDKVKYHNTQTCVEIVCPTHGSFFQKPLYHIHRKSGCLKCYREKQTYTKERFLQQTKQKFNNKFSYGKYNGYRNTIEVVCPKHGKFITTPINHLRDKGGCKECRDDHQRLSLSQCINRFKQIHGNRYDYSKVIYKNCMTKVEVICRLHGSFSPTPINHVRGHNCPVCACVDKYVGGYCKEYFDKNPHRKDDLGILYFIKIPEESSVFYKVGITDRTIEKRFKSVLPYQYQIVHQVKAPLYEAHKRETQILKITNRYIPLVKFPGWTECFVCNSPNAIIQIMNDG